MSTIGSKTTMPAASENSGDRPHAVADEFDRLAFEYETNRLSDWYKGHGDIIIKALPAPLTGCLLDIGCGTGWLLRKILKSRQSVTAVGIDVSANMIAQARNAAARENIRNVEFIHADWEKLDLSVLTGKEVTTVICASTFHYFADPAAASEKMFRSLKKGGRFFLLERDKADSSLTKIWDFLHKYVIKDDARFYRSNELAGFYADAGFCKVKVQAKIRKLFWRNKLYTNLVLLSGQKI